MSPLRVTDELLDEAGRIIASQLEHLIDTTGHRLGDQIPAGEIRWRCSQCGQVLPTGTAGKLGPGRTIRTKLHTPRPHPSRQAART